jgi:hypothetical protein
VKKVLFSFPLRASGRVSTGELSPALSRKNMNHLLGSVAHSSSPGDGDDLGSIEGFLVCGKHAAAVSILEQYDREVLSVSEWKHAIRPHAELSTAYKWFVGSLAMAPVVYAKPLAAVAYVSGKVYRALTSSLLYTLPMSAACAHVYCYIEAGLRLLH